MIGGVSGFVLRKAAKSLKFGRRISPFLRRKNIFEKMIRASFYDAIWRRVVEKIDGSIEKMHGGFYRISVDGATTFVRGAQVGLDSHLTLELAGNKPLVYQLLSEMQITCLPKYRTYTCLDICEAQDFLKANGGPLVVKPAAGTGAGAGVTTGISSNSQLFRASALAGSFCNDLLIEEQFAGESYRLLFLEGVFIDAIQRCPPTIVADGESTISALVDKENSDRRCSDGQLSVSLLEKDTEMRSYLAEQGLSLRSVLPGGQTIVLKRVINQNNSTDNHRVFESVHPSFVELGEKVVKGLKIKFAGIDIIALDISRPADSQSYVMNDINTNPGLHHHYLLSNNSEERDIGEIVIRYILFNQRPDK